MKILRQEGLQKKNNDHRADDGAAMKLMHFDVRFGGTNIVSFVHRLAAGGLGFSTAGCAVAFLSVAGLPGALVALLALAPAVAGSLAADSFFTSSGCKVVRIITSSSCSSL